MASLTELRRSNNNNGHETDRPPKKNVNKLLQGKLDPTVRYQEYARVLSALAIDNKGIPELGMSPIEVNSLAVHAVQQEHAVVGDKGRIEGLKRKLPPSMDTFERIVEGDLKRQPRFQKHTKAQLKAATKILLETAWGLVDTPKALVSYALEPAPEGAVLTETMLDEAFYFVLLSGEGSVAAQLEDPIEHYINGVGINLRAKGYDEEITKGYKLPVQLLNILKTLKYRESEEVFARWILGQCSKTGEDFEITARFLRIFLYSTTYWDSSLHMDLWKPPVNLPNREREFLVRTFQSIISSLEYAAIHLSRAKAGDQILNELAYLKELAKLGFGGVFNPKYRTSNYTAAEKALTPTAGEFADYAYAILSRTRAVDQRKAAIALIKRAESIGIRDINPLLEKLTDMPILQRFLISEGKVTGLIPDSEAKQVVWQNLLAEPWYDLGEYKLDQVISPETSHIIFYVFTGTFGPFTKGHKELVQTLENHLDKLPEKDEEERVVQRLILILPMVDPIGIPGYTKIPSRVGTLKERASSIMLHLSSGVSRKRVFITTLFQPDPTIEHSLEERAEESIMGVGAKAYGDLRRAQRRANIKYSWVYTYGSDAIKWDKAKEAVLEREQQPRRVKADGGIVIVRKGWLRQTLEKLDQIKSETGIEHVILTPGTAFSSSSAAIDEFHSTGRSDHFEPGVQFYFKKHWSKGTIAKREANPNPVEYLSVNQIYQELLDEIQDYLARNS